MDWVDRVFLECLHFYDAVLLLNQQDQCFGGSLTIVFDLYPMVDNHQSSDARFAMNHSCLTRTYCHWGYFRPQKSVSALYYIFWPLRATFSRKTVLFPTRCSCPFIFIVIVIVHVIDVIDVLLCRCQCSCRCCCFSCCCCCFCF